MCPTDTTWTSRFGNAFCNPLVSVPLLPTDHISLISKSIVFATADNFIDFLTFETVEKIKKLGIYTVGFLGDDEFNNNQYKFLSGWFDMFVVYVKKYVAYYEEFSKKKGYWLPNSCHLKASKRTFTNKPDKDCVFIGGPIADRVELIREVSNAGFSVEIYGSKKWSYIQDLKDK